MSAPIFVTGGAGFIGANLVHLLCEAKRPVVVFDNLSTGLASNLPQQVTLIEGDIRDTKALHNAMATHKPAAVMHFAALIAAGESVTQPNEYYAVNTQGTLNVLEAMRAAKIKTLIFSSTAAVYGEPQYCPIDLNHPCQPINPYGHSKHMAEQIIADATAAYDMHAMAIRYFNVAGASCDGQVGVIPTHCTHLIPRVIKAIENPQTPICILGTDYPTTDGTCIRDYIHVRDIAAAHLLALNYLTQQSSAEKFNLINCGNGQGYSVKEVIQAAERVTGKTVPVTLGARRAGDPSALVADASTAQKMLGWQPKLSLDDMLHDVWRFHQQWQQHSA